MLQITIPRGHSLIYGKKELKKALRAAANLVKKEATALTKNAIGNGRAYSTPRTMTKGVHYASAPGQPPAALTGALSRSITIRPPKTSRDGTDSVTVRDTMFYAKFLEVGAKGGGKGKTNIRAKTKKRELLKASTGRVLLPRPFISRVLQDNERTIDQMIKEAVKADIEFK